MAKSRLNMFVSILVLCIILLCFKKFAVEDYSDSNKVISRSDALNKQNIQVSKPSSKPCQKNNEIKYIIYDGHNTKSAFNDIVLNLPPDWNFLLVNANVEKKESHNMDQCSKCKIFEGQLKDGVFKSIKELSELQRTIPLHMLNLFAAYNYVLHQNAQWIYTTSGLHSFDADWLNYATCNLPKTGLFYSSNDGNIIFDACKHFSGTSQPRVFESQVFI